MKQKVYLETTVISYLTSWPRRDIVVAACQQITREWWTHKRSSFELYISQFVLDEAASGDPRAAVDRVKELRHISLLEVSEEVIALADELVRRGALPKKAVVDAFHIAVSAVHEMNFLLTWNCKHIANAQLKAKIQGVCEDNGFQCPIICTPQELAGD